MINPAPIQNKIDITSINNSIENTLLFHKIFSLFNTVINISLWFNHLFSKEIFGKPLFDQNTFDNKLKKKFDIITYSIFSALIILVSIIAGLILYLKKPIAGLPRNFKELSSTYPVLNNINDFIKNYAGHFGASPDQINLNVIESDFIFAYTSQALPCERTNITVSTKLAQYTSPPAVFGFEITLLHELSHVKNDTPSLCRRFQDYFYAINLVSSFFYIALQLAQCIAMSVTVKFEPLYLYRIGLALIIFSINAFAMLHNTRACELRANITALFDSNIFFDDETYQRNSYAMGGMDFCCSYDSACCMYGSLFATHPSSTIGRNLLEESITRSQNRIAPSIA